MAEIEDLKTAVRVLALYVHDEYPNQYSLTEIATGWTLSGVSDEDIAALARVEAALFPVQ